jgi:hypothetical protein
MKKIRIGNTVALSWEIFIHDGDEVLPYDLTGKAISVYLINAFATVKIKDFITEDNVLSFTWEGSEQRFAGVYQLTLVENENTDTMLTFDECEAFELVRCSCSDDDIEKVELSSKLNMVRVYPIVPVIGPNSNWWVDGVDTGKPSRGEKGEDGKDGEGGGSIDPELLEAYMPLSRDFSDDFNNDFTR